MSDCIFCKIAAREIGSTVVYEDEEFLAFRDINPVAPTHVLLIPKKHVSSLLEVPEQDAPLMGRMLTLAAKLAGQLGLAEDGFRVVINTGKNGGQTVEHLHFHLLGGRALQWPPG
ncbi:MAG TPA: histidine triad nucleotide-binding protein [Syntrophomonadaceae bacterium]|nr:histidine triad nucleotide-binding protein [Syntrophomonadaceae bacterium]